MKAIWILTTVYTPCWETKLDLWDSCTQGFYCALEIWKPKFPVVTHPNSLMSQLAPLPLPPPPAPLQLATIYSHQLQWRAKKVLDTSYCFSSLKLPTANRDRDGFSWLSLSLSLQWRWEKTKQKKTSHTPNLSEKDVPREIFLINPDIICHWRRPLRVKHTPGVSNQK